MAKTGPKAEFSDLECLAGKSSMTLRDMVLNREMTTESVKNCAQKIFKETLKCVP